MHTLHFPNSESKKGIDLLILPVFFHCTVTARAKIVLHVSAQLLQIIYDIVY